MAKGMSGDKKIAEESPRRSSISREGLIAQPLGDTSNHEVDLWRAVEGIDVPQYAPKDTSNYLTEEKKSFWERVKDDRRVVVTESYGSADNWVIKGRIDDPIKDFAGFAGTMGALTALVVATMFCLAGDKVISVSLFLFAAVMIVLVIMPCMRVTDKIREATVTLDSSYHRKDDVRSTVETVLNRSIANTTPFGYSSKDGKGVRSEIQAYIDQKCPGEVTLRRDLFDDDDVKKSSVMPTIPRPQLTSSSSTGKDISASLPTSTMEEKLQSIARSSSPASTKALARDLRDLHKVRNDLSPQGLSQLNSLSGELIDLTESQNRLKSTPFGITTSETEKLLECVNLLRQPVAKLKGEYLRNRQGVLESKRHYFEDKYRSGGDLTI